MDIEAEKKPNLIGMSTNMGKKVEAVKSKVGTKKAVSTFSLSYSLVSRGYS